MDISRSIDVEEVLSISAFLDKVLPMAPTDFPPASSTSYTSSFTACSETRMQHAEHAQHASHHHADACSSSPSPPPHDKESSPSPSPPSAPPPSAQATFQISQTFQCTLPNMSLTFSQQYSFPVLFTDPSSSQHPQPMSQQTSSSQTSSQTSSPSDLPFPSTFPSIVLPANNALPFPAEMFPTKRLPSFATLHQPYPETLRVFTDTAALPSALPASKKDSEQHQLSICHPAAYSPPTRASPSPPPSPLRTKSRAQPAPAPCLRSQQPRGRPTDHSGDFQRTVQNLIYKHNVNAQWHAFRKQRKCSVARAPCVKGYVRFCDEMSNIREFAELRNDPRYRNLGSRTECKCPYSTF